MQGQKKMTIIVDGNEIIINFHDQISLPECVHLLANSIAIIIKDEVQRDELLDIVFETIEEELADKITDIKPEQLN